MAGTIGFRETDRDGRLRDSIRVDEERRSLVSGDQHARLEAAIDLDIEQEGHAALRV